MWKDCPNNAVLGASAKFRPGREKLESSFLTNDLVMIWGLGEPRAIAPVVNDWILTAFSLV